MLIVYGSALVALACWATFTTWKTVAAGGWRSTRRTLGPLGTVFVASCLLPGVAMLSGRFAPWMLIPLGVCYLLLIPFPCYFKWANEGWVRKGRVLLFLLAGAGLIAVGVELLPVAWFGIT